jgi:hypothetical protein
MQKWLLMVVALGLLTAAPAVWAENATDVQPIKSPDGQTLAVLVQCNNCPSSSGKSTKCHTGAEKGYLGGKPCGQCMITENYGVALVYPYDLHFTGKLVDDQGEPIKDRFVKVFMANGWSIRTRTSAEGTYRLMLGATAERKSTKPVVIDLGTRVDSPKANKDFYAMFLLPDGYKACPAAAKAEPKAHKKKATKP